MATKLQFLAVAGAILCAQAVGVNRHLRTAHRMPAQQGNATYEAGGQQAAGAPCACEATSSSWVPAFRTAPQCVFIDLGAANGNTYAGWLAHKFGDISTCPSGGRYEAHLVEANPNFAQPLKSLQDQNSAVVHSHAPMAAYMCTGKTEFYIDTVNHENNYWGSSMSPNHQDVVRSGHQRVAVPTVNVIQLIVENAIPADYVVVKMDIEGAEWDILPCLARSQAASLIDELLIEVHPSNLGHTGTTPGEFQWAISELVKRGVKVPNYSSPTL